MKSCLKDVPIGQFFHVCACLLQVWAPNRTKFSEQLGIGMLWAHLWWFCWIFILEGPSGTRGEKKLAKVEIWWKKFAPKCSEMLWAGSRLSEMLFQQFLDSNTRFFQYFYFRAKKVQIWRGFSAGIINSDGISLLQHRSIIRTIEWLVYFDEVLRHVI